jgi:hypothetical protein
LKHLPEPSINIHKPWFSDRSSPFSPTTLNRIPVDPDPISPPVQGQTWKQVDPIQNAWVSNTEMGTYTQQQPKKSKKHK